MKVLVTGGCGFIGAGLVRRLVGNGHAVTVYDNLSRGMTELLDGVEHGFVKGDIRELDDMADAMAGHDAVVHLAAYGSVVESIDDPLTNFDINARGTLVALEAARQAGVERFVMASTGGAIVGDAEPPVNEQSLPSPKAPYGASKMAGEGYCRCYGRSLGLHTVMLRFANVYGPFSAHKKGAITAFSRCIMTGEPIVIFGDGSATRDFIYVDDLCKGIELGMTSDVAPGEVFHLATGRETSVAELARLLCEAAGAGDHPIVHHPERPGEIYRNFARYDKAKAVMGFEPEVGLEDGLKRTWDWFDARREAVLSAVLTDS
ncbi:MAG: NAD-dependent epimerase/dehydratase family protein [Planctomycetota bacterium]